MEEAPLLAPSGRCSARSSSGADQYHAGVLLTEHLNRGLPPELQANKLGLLESLPVPEAPKALAEATVLEKVFIKTSTCKFVSFHFLYPFRGRGEDAGANPSCIWAMAGCTPGLDTSPSLGQ